MVAVLVLGMGWWFWPRVDQRLVGTWLVEPSDVPSGHRIFMFNADHRGTEIVDAPVTEMGRTYHNPVSRKGLHWWIDGDRLLVQDGSNRSTNKAQLLLKKLMASLTGGALPTAYDLQIKEVSGNSVSLLRTGPPGSPPTVMTLRRVQEWPPSGFVK